MNTDPEKISPKKEKVLVAMSGGVDSSVAVLLLKKQGYEVSGATMKLLPDDNDRIEKTKRLAEKMGIELMVFDLCGEFQKEVIEEFAKAYINGLTPNPCIMCNKKFKFGKFYEKAMELGFDKMATGHYAGINISENGSYRLCRSKNPAKDQSYFLYGITQNQLKNIIFPLEMFDKEEIREIAENAALDNATQKDSQDICFVPEGKYTDIIDKYCEKYDIQRKKGIFVSSEGKFLGLNEGIERYTIGQRKGVGMSLAPGGPLYVVEKRCETGEVVMGEDKLLYKDRLTVSGFSFTSVSEEEEKSFFPARALVRTRFNQRDAKEALVERSGDGKIRITFDNPVRAIAPGQAAVLYQGDVVLGGGTID